MYAMSSPAAPPAAPGPPKPTGRLTPQALATVAHPLRARLLEAVRALGEASATTLAYRLDTNTGVASYHLRKLAAAGLIEDSGTGHGKERRWRPSAVATNWSAPARDDLDDDGLAALTWLERDYVRHFAERAERWLDVADGWPANWRDALGMTDAAVLVTPAQLATLRAELDQVLARYRRVGQGNPEAKRVAYYGYCFPVDLTSARP